MRGTTATVPYIDLPMGEDLILYPSDEANTIPIDNSHQGVRQFSPFVIEVVPPNFEYGLKQSNLNQVVPFASPLRPNDSRLRAEIVRGDTLPNLSSLAGPPIRIPQGQTNQSFSRQGLTPTIEPLSASYTEQENLIDYVTQARALATLPPIVFLINPTSFEVSYNSIQAFQEQTRYGFVFQRWGEELPTISISCGIGAYMSGRTDGRPGRGLHMTSKRDSAGYRQLMSILSVYRNGVAIYDRVGRSRAYHAIGRQVIHYDGQTWEGRIESMSFTEDESHQNGGITFDLSFTVYSHKYNDQMTAEVKDRLTLGTPKAPETNPVERLRTNADAAFAELDEG